MPVEFIDALEYGVLGLCVVAMYLAWRVLQGEQTRDGEPRRGILRATYGFMTFVVVLALVNGYVQLAEADATQIDPEEMAQLEQQLRESEDKLLAIRSAATPILSARAGIVGQLPPGPERATLQNLIEALQKALR